MAGVIVPRKTGHRIKAGTTTVVLLTSTYAITAFPMQSDQPDDALWELAGDPKAIPTPARISSNADGSKSADGFYTFEFRFSYMTFLMVKYWLDTFLAGGVQSAAVTVMAYDETDTAVFLTALLLKPNLSEATKFTGGYTNVVWRFVLGVVIT